MQKKYEILLDTNQTISKDIFNEVNYPWEVLPNIKNFILDLIPKLSDEFYEYAENVYIHKSVILSDFITIKGPCIIDENTEVRPGAFIRGNAIIGKNCVVGNSTEIKNAIIFDNVQMPHYNYIGDSILGYHSHTGAGVILSNVKSDNKNVVIHDEINIETNMRKVGSIIGHHADIGCNSVLCPGTVIGESSVVYPLTRVRGVIKDNVIVKSMNDIVERRSENA